MVGRILLIILLILIVLIFFVPYGVDAELEEGAFRLSVQAGPIRVKIFPRKRRKPKPPKEPPAAPEPPKEKPLDEKEKIPKKLNLDMETILALLKMAIHAIRRLFRSFTVNLFRLHYTVATGDPYSTAMQYGTICAAIEALTALCGSVIRVGKRDIEIGSDFLGDRPSLSLRITLTLQLYLIVHMAVAFLVEFIVWKVKNRGQKPAAEKERKDQHGTERL